MARVEIQSALLTLLCAGGLLAQDAQTPPPAAPPAPAPQAPPAPTKAPKPKSRLKLIQQMQVDLDMAASRAKVDDKGRKKLDKCHEVLIDAAAQQQRYKSINVGKVNGCLKDLDALGAAGAFVDADRDKIRLDRENLGDVLGKSHRIRLPQPL